MTRACELLNVSRRRLNDQAIRKDDELVTTLKELARHHPRFGIRQLRRKLLLGGRRVNLKRVRRLCKLHGLTLRPRRRRKRLGIGVGMPCRADRPNHVWAYDFVEDRTETGRKLRILTVVDEFTRRCIEVEIEHRMNAKFVAWTLRRLFVEHGTPTFVRSDNGPEFIAKFLMNVIKIHGIAARHIDPGSPWQNGIDERFNGTLRDECLNLETFHHRDHARAVVKLFKRTYNEQRPHGSLGEAMTPMMFYERWQKNQAGSGQENSELCPVPRKLSFCASAAVRTNESRLTEMIDQSESRQAIPVTAPVASQKNRILREDEIRVAGMPAAGTFPASNSPPAPKT